MATILERVQFSRIWEKFLSYRVSPKEVAVITDIFNVDAGYDIREFTTEQLYAIDEFFSLIKLLKTQFREEKPQITKKRPSNLVLNDSLMSSAEYLLSSIAQFSLIEPPIAENWSLLTPDQQLTFIDFLRNSRINFNDTNIRSFLEYVLTILTGWMSEVQQQLSIALLGYSQVKDRSGMFPASFDPKLEEYVSLIPPEIQYAVDEFVANLKINMLTAQRENPQASIDDIWLKLMTGAATNIKSLREYDTLVCVSVAFAQPDRPSVARLTGFDPNIRPTRTTAEKFWLSLIHYKVPLP